MNDIVLVQLQCLIRIVQKMQICARIDVLSNAWRPLFQPRPREVYVQLQGSGGELRFPASAEERYAAAQSCECAARACHHEDRCVGQWLTVGGISAADFCAAWREDD